MPLAPRPDIHAYWPLIRDDVQALQRFVTESYDTLVQQAFAFWKRYRTLRGLEFDDLVSHGAEALIRCIRRYNHRPDMPDPFWPFAGPSCRLACESGGS